MARPTPFRRLAAFGIVVAFAAVFVCASSSAAATRTAPTRPAAQTKWRVAKLYGSEYVDLHDVAVQWGLKPTWIAPNKKLSLRVAEDRTIVFDANERDCFLDNTRVFLAETVVEHRGHLWVGKLDLIKTIAPLLRPRDQTLLLPPRPRLIVLDPGHGGTDPGKYNATHKISEKDMTLDVAKRLQSLLEERGFRVLLTRTGDSRFSNNPAVDLPMRADVANKALADLFISIHFNAVDPKDAARVKGAETYVLTPREMVSTQPENDKTMVTTEYPGNRQDIANVLLGFHLHRQIVTDLQMSDRGFKRFRYAVLRTLNCPGVLVEAAYLSNDEEAARVARPEFRQQIAEAIADGIESYGAALKQ